jgi:hypothetical protein
MVAKARPAANGETREPTYKCAYTCVKDEKNVSFEHCSWKEWLNRRAIVAIAALGSAAVSLTACDSRDRAADGAATKDTVVVRSTASAQARREVALTPLDTVKGYGPGNPFGRLEFTKATPDGGVLVVDSKSEQGFVIRRFGADGRYLNAIGRSGEGPGEYSARGWPYIAVNANGVISVRDARAMIHQYGMDGRLIGEFTYLTPRGEVFGGIYPGPDSSVYIAARYNAAVNGVLFARVDSRGNVVGEIEDDGLWTPPGPPQFGVVRESRDPMPDGGVVHFASEKAGFLVTRHAQKLAPLVAELDIPPVPYLARERKGIQDVAEWRARMFPPEDQRPAPRLPDFKPLGKGVGGRDLDDRVWVGLSTTAQRVPPRMVAQINSDSITVSYWEPREYAVFRSTGEYLGIVSFPIEVITWALPIGDTVWVALAAEDGAHVLVRFGLPEQFRAVPRQRDPSQSP